MPPLTCQVWIADLAAQHPDHDLLLNEVEQARRDYYRVPNARAAFTVGVALLRIVVAAELGVEPHAVSVDRTCTTCGKQHGKPRLPGTNVHVSVSHSGEKVAVAMTRAGAVGVDVEAITARDVASLARTVLAPVETLRRDKDFYVYWCRKEAVVKATGDGLRVPLPEVVVAAPDAPAALISYQDRHIVCTMCDLPVAAGYAGAVAVLAPGELDITVHDAAELLGVAIRETP